MVSQLDRGLPPGNRIGGRPSSPPTQSRKARHCNCYPKNYRVRSSRAAKCWERLLSR